MPIAVTIDGACVPPGEARVSVFDRGFLYGDSVYEVVRTYGLRPFELPAHLDRLAESATRTGLRLPWTQARFEEEVDRVIAASRGGDEPVPGAAPWNEGERSVRIVVTRGAGELGLDPALATRPTVVMLSLPLRGPPLAAYREGVKAWPHGAGRHPRGGDPSAKTGEHLFHVLAVGEAREHGAQEALLLDGAGCVTEGASSNVFAVRGGVLETPPLGAGILAGVTRAVVVDLARRLGIPFREAPLPLAALEAADEAFLTSTVREVLPLAQVGERRIGAGTPGPLTRRLHAAFRERAGAATGSGGVAGPG
ncbi:MAG TPA: aminotransferase class IV [Anaeromyxobacteraceae bacterium]|nr:aminotransferase class IV [Anaeromyxobacteraceae bacterium]